MTRQSESVDMLAAALVAFQAEMVTVPKGSVNPFFKSTYADLADCVKTAAPVATTHGIAVTQHIGLHYLTTRLWHSSGQWIEEDADLSYAKENDPQSQGSAITYMRRYAYCAALGIVADQDDDGNATRTVKAKPEQYVPLEPGYERVNDTMIPKEVPMEVTRSYPPADPSDVCSPKQANYAKALLLGLGLNEDEKLTTWFSVNDLGAWPGSVRNLSKFQAQGVIERLKP